MVPFFNMTLPAPVWETPHDAGVGSRTGPTPGCPVDSGRTANASESIAVLVNSVRWQIAVPFQAGVGVRMTAASGLVHDSRGIWGRNGTSSGASRYSYS